MVYLKRDLPHPGNEELDNTYWAIGHSAAMTERMKNAHRDYRPEPISPDEMILRIDRRARGLLIYENCLVRELKGFIQARGLKLPKGSRVKKEHLVAVLEQADEDPKFHKFRDLPAELRNNIYGKYFDALPSLPLQPYQPPLTLVPSLRAESLPFFWDNCTFTFDFHITTRRRRGFLFNENTTIISDITTAHVDRLYKRDFARIRRIKLRLWDFKQVWNHKLKVYETTASSVADWYADLYASEGLHRKHRWSTSNQFFSSLNLVDGVLVKFLDEIRARPSEERFNKRDLDDFRRVLNSVYLE